MKCLFLYNPKSGKGKIIKKLDYIIKTLEHRFQSVDVYETTSANDLIEVVKEKSTQYDAIIFSGGDGTFNDVTCGVAALEKRPVLGYIPTGTANDIARNLRISRNVKKALKVIVEGHTIKHDVGRINDRYFMYVAAIGVCTGTSYTTKHQTKKILGRFAYLFNGLEEFFTAPVSDVKYISDEQTIQMKAPLLLVMNSKSVGGICFNKYGHLNDGYFDVILIKEDNVKGRLNILKTFIFGLLGRRHSNYAIFLRSKKFKIEVNEKATWCVDGEEGPKGSIEVENLKGHLEIYAPKNKIKKEKNNVR